tara:strand:+ start:605 stop:1042 length:438 start_codon:yes stop_codon:yes gene_type:complete
MNENYQIPKTNINISRAFFRLKNLRFILVFLTGVILPPIQLAKSEEIFLKCTGKFEINRGELIKPDWETSYLKINLDGLKSTIKDNGFKKEGRTSIRRNTYTITHRDASNRIKAKYKIDGTSGMYIVEYPQIYRSLIGICQKGRG